MASLRVATDFSRVATPVLPPLVSPETCLEVAFLPYWGNILTATPVPFDLFLQGSHFVPVLDAESWLLRSAYEVKHSSLTSEEHLGIKITSALASAYGQSPKMVRPAELGSNAEIPRARLAWFEKPLN